MGISPIILFVYKRVDCLKLTVSSLVNNKLAGESVLFIFSDGPKSTHDELKIQEVRRYLKSITGFKSVQIFESETNMGLAASVINGTTIVLKQFSEAIIIEDDLIVSENFLTFMNLALEKYRYNTGVFSISGYSFDLGHTGDEGDTYFLPRGWSWGWATWADRWETVDWELNDYSINGLCSMENWSFARGGSDLPCMLRKQMKGKIDSWAIRWFYSQFKRGLLTLYPVRSLVSNVGFGEDSTHTKGSDHRYKVELTYSSKCEFKFPNEVRVDMYYLRKFQWKMGVLSRLKSKIDSLITKCLLCLKT